MTAPEPIIEVDNVTTAFDGHVIHRHLNLTVHRGEVVALIGGSGSGKTTLLRLLLGLEVPQAGTVKIFGHPLGRCAWSGCATAGACFSRPARCSRRSACSRTWRCRCAN
jgi:ABC-type transporter Mla maintaining outer membrane lipid asymmetry ATPase subunit MlaF